MNAMKGASKGKMKKQMLMAIREMNFPDSSVISQCVLKLERAKVK